MMLKNDGGHICSITCITYSYKQKSSSNTGAGLYTLNMIYSRTNLNIDERIAGKIQRLQTDKIIQSVSQTSDLLFMRPRKAQTPDITYLIKKIIHIVLL